MADEEKGVKEAEATPAAETLGGSDVQEAAPEAKAAPSNAGDVNAGVKTYTEKEVNEILHNRTKEMSDMRKENERYKSLGSYDDINAKLNPTPKPEPAASTLSAEDKQFVEYLQKVMPGVNNLGKLNEQHIKAIEAYQAREEKANTRYLSSMEESVGKYCETSGIKDEAHKKGFLDMVASVISTDEKLYERFLDRDQTVTQDAIKRLEETLGSRLAKKEVSELANVKAKVEKIQQPLPTGGIPAPISKERKMTDEERVDAAFAKLTGGK